MSESCFVCQTVAEERCPNCSRVGYCTNHKQYHLDGSGGCFPYLVEEREEVGRVLVASRDLLPGEEIFRERELVVGPSKTTPPVCLGCGKLVNIETKCKGCQWLLCSSSCSEMANHTQAECEIISRSVPEVDEDNKSSNSVLYGAVLPLRVLLLGKRDLDYFLQFMDHREEKKRTKCERTDNEEEEENWARVIREQWGQDHFSAELVERIAGILDINTVEHRVPHSPSGRGFLPITSLASHSCCSNSFKDKSDEGWVTTRAKTVVTSGEEITFHYTGGLKGRLLRRPALREGWCFSCRCDRCSSPSELGSEMSTLLCQVTGCLGALRPVSPDEFNSTYSCDLCSMEISEDAARDIEACVTRELEACYRNDTASLYSLYNRITSLHPNHYLVHIIRWLLVTGWGRIKGQENNQLEEKVLEAKIDMCRQYLALLDIIDPGISHNRGMTLWEQYSANTFLVNKRFQEERLSPVKFLSGLRESLELVEKAIWALQHNPVSSSEHKLREMSIAARDQLNQTITFFSSVVPGV